MRALVLAYNGRIKAVAVACLMSVPISLAIDIATRLGLFVIIGQLTLSMFFALFFLLIVNGAEEGRHFRSSFLRFFGKISYCLYLVHQPIAGFMHGLLLREVPDVGTIAQFSITLSSLGLSIAIATLSWTYFEAPLIAFGHRWRYRNEAAPDMGPPPNWSRSEGASIFGHCKVSEILPIVRGRL